MPSPSGLPANRTNAVATALSVIALAVGLLQGWGLTSLLAVLSTLLWGSLLVLGVRRRRRRGARQTFDAR